MCEMSLSQLRCGDRAVISKFISENDNIRRLQEMGIHSGVFVRVIKYAPFGDPLEIKVRGFHISLRRSIADKIYVIKKNINGK
jgi:ferrous iron transport protein A